MTTETETEPQTLEDLEARRDVVEEEMAAIAAKLENVRAKRHLTGEYADPDWYRRATTRKRFLGVEHQRLNRRIADAKRALRQAHADKVERAFVGVARDLLDPVTFDTIMAKARAAAAG